MPATHYQLPGTLEESHVYIQRQAAQIEQLEAKVNWLIEHLRRSQHQRFGSSSEQTSSMVQGDLFSEAESQAKAATPAQPETEEIAYTRAKGKRGRHGIPENLPIVLIEHRIPEDERICGKDGTVLHEMSTEERYELDIEPARARLLHHVTYVYACRTCEKNETQASIMVAPAPKPVIPKSLASPFILAYVMTMKYVDGLPLYRLEKHFARLGIKIGRSVLSNWMLKGAEWLKLIYAVMKRHLLERDLLQADETTVQVLKEPGRPAESKSYAWLYRTGGGGGPPIVLFDYQMTRSADHPKNFLQGFRGFLHVDGYVGYDNLPNVILVGCWAHARRKFDEAIKSLPLNLRKQPGMARDALDIINKLFLIERKLKGCSAEERKAQRNELSRPIVDKFEKWLDEAAKVMLPKSALGTAVNYCRNQWPKLIRFLEDGRLELDNNRAERSIKPFVMGRKAWLFSNTPQGAQASAVIYSIVETAKESGLNPCEYLAHLFKQLPNIDIKNPDALEELMPWNVVLQGKESEVARPD